MEYKNIRSIFTVFVIGIIFFATIGTPVQAQEGVAIGTGAVVTVCIALLNQVITAVTGSGTAIACAKAKTSGPDDDDDAVDYDDDWDQGLDWSLDAWTDVVKGMNNVDDGEENPYTPGFRHEAYVEIHFESTGGVWQPDPSDCIKCPNGKKKAVYGWVMASPEDDPTITNQKTYAAAAAAFSADGKTVDFCYAAGVSTTPAGGIRYDFVKKVPCSPIPEFALQQGTAFLASIDRFTFEDVGGDYVIIRPLLGPTIDLFHSYLQNDGNLLILPLLRGHGEQVQELKRDIYEERIDGTSWVLSESPGELADLTIVGAALHFDELQVTRAGRSNAEMLEEYFLSSSAVTLVAPEHAQEGYEPQVMFRELINSGQDITGIIGRDYVLPVNGDPSEPVEDDPLVGLVLGVEGGIDEAVTLAINTEGHFVRDLADEAWDGVSDNVEFKIPGLDYHHEDTSSLSDIAVASPYVIPEFTTIAIPVVAILGLLFLFSRRRRKE